MHCKPVQQQWRYGAKLKNIGLSVVAFIFGTDGTFCGQEEVVKKEKLYKQYFSTVKYSLEGTKGH